MKNSGIHEIISIQTLRSPTRAGVRAENCTGILSLSLCEGSHAGRPARTDEQNGRANTLTSKFRYCCLVACPTASEAWSGRTLNRQRLQHLDAAGGARPGAALSSRDRRFASSIGRRAHKPKGAFRTSSLRVQVEGAPAPREEMSPQIERFLETGTEISVASQAHTYNAYTSRVRVAEKSRSICRQSLSHARTEPFSRFDGLCHGSCVVK